MPDWALLTAAVASTSSAAGMPSMASSQYGLYTTAAYAAGASATRLMTLPLGSVASAHPARHSQNAVSGNSRRMASGAVLASTASSAAAENIEYGVAGGCGIMAVLHPDREHVQFQAGQRDRGGQRQVQHDLTSGGPGWLIGGAPFHLPIVPQRPDHAIGTGSYPVSPQG